ADAASVERPRGGRDVVRQAQDERRSRAGPACDAYPSAQVVRGAAGPGESEPGPAVEPGRRAVDLAELVEDRSELLGGDADPRILDDPLDPAGVPARRRAARLAPHRDGDPPLAGELEGVGDQVLEDLDDLGAVGPDRDLLLRRVDLERDAFGRVAGGCGGKAGELGRVLPRLLDGGAAEL